MIPKNIVMIIPKIALCLGADGGLSSQASLIMSRERDIFIAGLVDRIVIIVETDFIFKFRQNRFDLKGGVLAKGTLKIGELNERYFGLWVSPNRRGWVDFKLIFGLAKMELDQLLRWDTDRPPLQKFALVTAHSKKTKAKKGDG